MVCFFLILISLTLIFISVTEDDSEKVYMCHEGHLFEKPSYKQVMDYDGFDKRIEVCPVCGCDKSFYKEFYVKQIKKDK